jgi:membrane-bound serine protease (ClpP class)
VGTFIPDGAGSLFPQTAAEQSRLIGALATVLLAFVTGGIGVYFVSKHFGSLPLVNRLVLDAARDSEREESGDGPLLQAAAPPPLNEPQPGDFADTITALRPSGRVRVQGRSEDALARRGVIDAGVRVRLVERRGFSWVVEAAVDGGPSAAGEGDRVG